MTQKGSCHLRLFFIIYLSFRSGAVRNVDYINLKSKLMEASTVDNRLIRPPFFEKPMLPKIAKSEIFVSVTVAV